MIELVDKCSAGDPNSFSVKYIGLFFCVNNSLSHT